MADLCYETALSFVLATFVVYAIWLLFFKPFNLLRDFTEFGYKSINGKNLRKRDLVNLALKRRKIGNLPPPYPNSWFAVFESEQLQPGDGVKEIYVLGQNLVSWRGKKSRKVFVSDAYCPHLGAHLGVGGTVMGDCIQCPFHKWTFNGCTGNIEDIPYAKSELSGVRRAKLGGLRMWPVVETNGFVYIWHHTEHKEPSWYPEDIPEVVSGKWKYRGRSEFQVTCHIQEIPENGADMAHLDALHDAPSVSCDDRLMKVIKRFVKHKWSATWKVNQSPGKGHESIVNLSHHLSLFGDRIKTFNVNVTINQIGAGIVVMHFDTPFGKGILLQSVTPVEPLLQTITHRFYSEVKLIHPIAVMILKAEAIQISRDVEIWNRKCFLQKPILVKEDSSIKQFRRWFSQFYSDTCH